MFWFRVGILVCILAVFVFAGALVTSIILMMSEGTDQESIVKDPSLNGTIACYIIILIFQFILLGLCLFGLILCYKTWKNRFQMDHKLRHFFIVWVGLWAACLLCAMSIAIYSIVKGKDPQGQMGYMYEMFQKYTVDLKFVSSFERYQKDHNCCGLYGPDDWLIVQLRASPGGAGTMFQSMDYGFQQNPSTGKCHVIPPVIPTGCGAQILKEVNNKLGLFGGLIILEVIIGVVAACVAWYCFFYWLEKEVIVIPEDEISNVVIIEPDSSTMANSSNLSQSTARSSRPLGSGYMAMSRSYPTRGSIGSAGSIIVMHTMQYGAASTTGLMSPNHHRPETAQTHHHEHGHDHHGHHGTQSAIPMTTQSRLSAAGPFDSGSRATALNRHTASNLPPAMLSASMTQRYIGSSDHRTVPLRHNSYMETIAGSSTANAHHHHHHHEHDPNKPKETTLDKQLKALGGKVLAEMHVEHEKDKLNKELDPKKKKKKTKHPTIALVRKKPVDEEPPKPPGHHGQTGNLAEDIAEMSGKGASSYIEDVYIPVNPHKPKPPPPPEKPKMLGSINELGAANTIENLLGPKAVTEKTETVMKKMQEDEKLLVKPHFLPGFGPPGSNPQHKGHHGHGGSEVGHHGTVGSGTVAHGATHRLGAAASVEVAGHENAHYIHNTSMTHHPEHGHHGTSHGHDHDHHGTTHDHDHHGVSHDHDHHGANHDHDNHGTNHDHEHHGTNHDHDHGHHGTNHDHDHHHSVIPTTHHHETGHHQDGHYLGHHRSRTDHGRSLLSGHVSRTDHHPKIEVILPPPHHETGGHERDHYIEQHHHTDHDRPHYIEPTIHRNEHDHPHYPEPTIHHQEHERPHYQDPPLHHVEHDRPHYQEPPPHHIEHERPHYLDTETRNHERDRPHYLDPPPHHVDHDRNHYLGPPPHHIDHDRAQYLGPPPRHNDHERPHYQDPPPIPHYNDNGPFGRDPERSHYPNRNDHDRAHYLDGRGQLHGYDERGNTIIQPYNHPPGQHQTTRYLNEPRRTERYLEPEHHGTARYLRAGHHERARYIDPGSQRYSTYPPPEDRYSYNNNSYNNNFDDGYDYNDSYPRGEQGRAPYIDQRQPSRRTLDDPRDSYYRSRPFQPPPPPPPPPIYDDYRPRPSGRSRSPSDRSRSQSHSRSRSVPRSRISQIEDRNATVLYKNPKRLDDND